MMIQQLGDAVYYFTTRYGDNHKIDTDLITPEALATEINVAFLRCSNAFDKKEGTAKFSTYLKTSMLNAMTKLEQKLNKQNNNALDPSPLDDDLEVVGSLDCVDDSSDIEDLVCLIPEAWQRHYAMLRYKGGSKGASLDGVRKAFPDMGITQKDILEFEDDMLVRFG